MRRKMMLVVMMMMMMRRRRRMMMIMVIVVVLGILMVIRGVMLMVLMWMLMLMIVMVIRGERRMFGLGPGRYPPILEWLPHYKFEDNLMFDLIAGITVGVMAIPQSISYASIAGLPAQYGLYSDLQICYPIFGTSKYLVVGPVAVMSLMSRVAMDNLTSEMKESSTQWIQAVCFLSALVSVVQLVLGISRVGSRLSDVFLPEASIKAFTCAAALLIGSTQLSALLGTPSSSSTDFWNKVLHTTMALPEARIISIITSGITLTLLVAFRMLGSGIVNKLGPLFVVIASISVVMVMEVDHAMLPQVGYIPSGLPTPKLPVLPSLTSRDWMRLMVSAFPIALVGFAEATTIARATDTDNSLGNNNNNNNNDAHHVKLNLDLELLALAACNAFTSWIGGYPVTGSFSRSSINKESGARSSLSTGIAAVTVVVALSLVTPFLARLPKAVISSIVLSCIVNLVDVNEPRRLYKRWQRKKDPEVFVYIVVWMTSLTFGVEKGLLVGGVAHQLARMMKQEGNPLP